jgi:hypothetical protein
LTCFGSIFFRTIAPVLKVPPARSFGMGRRRRLKPRGTFDCRRSGGS